MIKRFCDMCGVEVHRNYVSDRYEPSFEQFKVEIMVYKGGTNNSGEMCLNCIKKIVAEGIERERHI